MKTFSLKGNPLTTPLPVPHYSPRVLDINKLNRVVRDVANARAIPAASRAMFLRDIQEDIEAEFDREK